MAIDDTGVDEVSTPRFIRLGWYPPGAVLAGGCGDAAMIVPGGMAVRLIS